MALTITSRGTGTHNTGATTLVPGGRTATLAAGSMGILCIALDNAGSAGATLISPASWTDAKGNVWTARQNALFDNGAASAGIEMVFYTGRITTALLTTDLGTITWNTGVSPVAKAWTWYEVIPSAGNHVEYDTGGTIAGATAANAQVITASIIVGNGVIAGYFSENVAAVTGDADSTNGTWTAQQTATIGATTSGVRIATQQKVQTTANSTQSYDVTVASQDRIAGYIAVKEVSNTVNQFGQAQADIEQTYKDKTGQAQAAIEATGRGFGQAQATIFGDPYPTAVMLDTPISYWRLGEPSGITAVDEMGVNNGTYENTPTLGVTGALVGDDNTAITLNGTNQDVDILDHASLDFGDIFSIEGWFKRGVIGVLQPLSDKGAIGGTGPLVYFGVDNTLRLATSGAGIGVVRTGVITDMVGWHHFVFTKNGATAKAYLDGIDVSIAGTPVTFANTTNHFRIGQETNAGSFFNGSIDEYAVYNYELSPARVLAHYVAGVGGTNRYGQAQAKIKQTYTQSAQAQADIKATYPQFAQAQTDIKATSNGFGQALAFISPFRGYGQANALVNGTFTQIIDTFTRSVTDGWGSPDSGDAWTQTTGLASSIDVNGSEGTIQSQNNNPVIIHNNKAILGQFSGVSVRYRFKFSAIPPNNTVFITSAAGMGTANNVPVVGFYHQVLIQSNGTLDISLGANGSANSLSLGLTPQVDTWYVLEVTHARVSGNAVKARAKLYLEGVTTAPYVGPSLQSTKVLPGHFALQVGQVSNTPLITIDDLEVVNASWTESGQAQALIQGVTTTRAYGQAQSDIKSIGRGFGQAQSNIKAVGFGFGQSQANIKQTYIQTGQAQSNIKQTYRGFGQAQATIQGHVHGQAQADIKQTYRGHGQAQSQIKQTYFALGQAQADIKATSNSFAQSQADIKAISRGLGQAQADIKAVGRGFGQANSDIKQVYTQSGQAQADIKNTYTSFGQANAWIEQTYRGFGQVQADIKQTYVQTGQAQAEIKQTYTQCAQSQAYIKIIGINQSGQAQARIKQVYIVVAQAQAKINAFGVNAFGQAQGNIKAEGNFVGGQAQAKINALGFNQHGQAQADIKATSRGFAQAQSDIKATFNAFAQAQAQIKQIYTQTAQAQADIKTTYTVSGQANAYIKIVNINAFAQAQAAIKNTYFGLGQAQAWIKVFGVNKSGQTQANIATRTNVSGQANARIKGIGVQGYGQAQADIKATSRGFGQAQADILKVSRGLGQANASIVKTSTVSAQAQANVKAISRSYAQAQADIKTKYVVSGQAQADIKVTYTQSGQANALIVTIQRQVAQAQGTIKTTYYSLAQAQANIKHTYIVSAQAQAVIKNIYSASGQAQTYIRLLGQSFAQAQAVIKSVGTATGQASVIILSGKTVSGNAQSTIKTTVNSYGQAQSIIETSYVVSGQAQALITTSSTVSGQAQAILFRPEAFGQAQALIKTVHTLANVTGEDERVIIVTGSDDAEEIDIEIVDESVTNVEIIDDAISVVGLDERVISVIIIDEAFI